MENTISNPSEQADMAISMSDLARRYDELQMALEDHEAHQQMYLNFYEHLPIGLLELDTQGIIRFINPSGAALLDPDVNSLRGKRFGLLLQAAYEPIFHRHKKLVLDTLAWQHCELLLKNTRRFVCLESKVINNKFGKPTVIQAYMTDTTVQSDIQKTMIQYHLDSIQKTHLKIAGELTSYITHEINQPLTAILNYCQTLENPSTELNGEAAIQASNKIKTQATRACDILKSLMKSVEQQILERIPTDLHTLIEDMIHATDLKFSSSGITLHHHYDHAIPQINIDPVQFGQVILNILNNAIEALATTSEKKPRITISTQRIDHANIVITISNNGPQISTKIIDRLFIPFFTTKSTGRGIGLALSRSIVEAHGGKLTVTSNAEETQFSIALNTEDRR